MKNVREKQSIQYRRQKHKLPIKSSHMDVKHQFPPANQQIEKNQGFGEDVGQLSLGVYVSHRNVSFFYMISQKVVSPLNMSHLFMKDWIFGY
jgi:hypothetical protein